jgi:2-isopropylmalate synthase
MLTNSHIELDDETLRDGLQSPSVTQPTLEQRVEILHLIDALGIQMADIGLPGAGPKVKESVAHLAREIVQSRLSVRPACAARTLVADIQPIVEISQQVGMPIEIHAFVGSSPIRQYAEDWSLERILRHTEEAVSFAVKHGCPIMYVTEDTTRSKPETIKTLLSTAVDCGATRVCLCDTVGYANPEGTKALIRYVREKVLSPSSPVRIDWHGHSDRSLALANALAAFEAGADRVHATALGIGERAGNTPMDLLLINLKLLGVLQRDLTKLREYCEAVSRYCGCPIPANYPVIGRDAFRTGTGVHAAAIIKSLAKEEHWLRDEIYSAVPASDFGLRQVIEVGPMSGKSNVLCWLAEQGLEPHAQVVDSIFERAKASSTVLSEDEIYRTIVQTYARKSL